MSDSVTCLQATSGVDLTESTMNMDQEHWYDGNRAFNPFYGTSEILENNFKTAMSNHKFAMLNQQLKDIPEKSELSAKLAINQESEENKNLHLRKDSIHSCGTSDESDQEINVKETTPKMLEESLEDGSQDTAEVKKARVENIITNIQVSPRNNAENQSCNTTQESRRKKRKQNQPQQHDISANDLLTPKYLKLDEQILVQQQLREMQEQLATMQRRYTKYFQDHLHKVDTDDSDDCDKGLIIDVGESGGQDLSIPSKKIHEDEALINHANKICQPEKLSEKADDLENLSKSLKAEITIAVDNAVNCVVKKFFDKSPTQQDPKVAEKIPEYKPVQDIPRVRVPEPTKKLERGAETEEEKLRQKLKTKVTDKQFGSFFDHMSARPYPLEVPLPFPRFFSPHSLYYPPTQVPLPQPLPPVPRTSEQTEALSLVCPPKKKRTKVTDTRLSPRAARALLQEPVPSRSSDGDHSRRSTPGPEAYSPVLPASLPTSVAIPNPILQQSDVLAMYSRGDFSMMHDHSINSHHSPPTGERGSPRQAHTPTDGLALSLMKRENDDSSSNDGSSYNSMMQATSTLTPMHLRKAKLMFFFVRYPSSAILKMYFPDIKFNKNNTAQLVKWFSNFREFYYIQMEKYARAATGEGVQNAEDLVVTTDSELYRVLNLHYNRNNQLEIPDSFRAAVQLSLREFFKSVYGGKDLEQSWKKQIYKVVARQDEPVPEYFKSPNWMEQLAD